MGVHPVTGTGLITSLVLAIRIRRTEPAIAEVIPEAIAFDATKRMRILSSWVLPEVVHVLADVFHVEAVVHEDDILIRSQVNDLGRDICYGWLAGSSQAGVSICVPLFSVRWNHPLAQESRSMDWTYKKYCVTPPLLTWM